MPLSLSAYQGVNATPVLMPLRVCFAPATREASCSRSKASTQEVSVRRVGAFFLFLPCCDPAADMKQAGITAALFVPAPPLLVC